MWSHAKWTWSLNICISLLNNICKAFNLFQQTPLKLVNWFKDTIYNWKVANTIIRNKEIYVMFGYFIWWVPTHGSYSICLIASHIFSNKHPNTPLSSTSFLFLLLLLRFHGYPYTPPAPSKILINADNISHKIRLKSKWSTVLTKCTMLWKLSFRKKKTTNHLYQLEHMQ